MGLGELGNFGVPGQRVKEMVRVKAWQKDPVRLWGPVIPEWHSKRGSGALENRAGFRAGMGSGGEKGVSHSGTG